MSKKTILEHPEWSVYNFDRAFNEYSKHLPKDLMHIVNEHNEEFKKFTHETNEFNAQKGRLINIILTIEGRLDSIILHYYFRDNEVLKSHFYNSFFKSTRNVDFSVKSDIVKSIFNTEFENIEVRHASGNGDKYAKIFTLLSRLINFRNTLAHSYHEYRLIPEKNSVKREIYTRLKEKGKELVFKAEFVKEVEWQMYFITKILEYVYFILVKKVKNEGIEQLFNIIMQRPIKQIEDYEKKWKSKANTSPFDTMYTKCVDEKYGVNPYYSAGKK